MSEPQPEYLPPSQPLQQPTPPPRLRRSCLSQLGSFLGWIFTLLLSVALALAAVAAIAYFGFGFRLQTPAEITNAPGEIAALRATNDETNARLGDLQTQVAQQSSAGSSNSEQLGDLDSRLLTLQTQVAAVEQQAVELQQLGRDMQALGQELEDTIALAATLQTDARDDQVVIAVFATAQADNTLRLNELQQRADRLTRFLERLGDIVGDTRADIATPIVGTPTAGPSISPTALPSITPPANTTPEPTPTATP